MRLSPSLTFASRLISVCLTSLSVFFKVYLAMRAAQCLHFKKLTFDRFAYFLRLFHIYFTMIYDLTLFKGHWFSQVLVFILIICKETTFLSAQMEKLTEKSILYNSVKWKRGILISALVGLGMWSPGCVMQGLLSLEHDLLCLTYLQIAEPKGSTWHTLGLSLANLTYDAMFCLRFFRQGFSSWYL